MRWDTGRSESLRYVAVELPKASNGWSARVLGELEGFTGGSVEWSADSVLGASGTLDYTASSAPDPSLMVRIEYGAEDSSGASESRVLGTFIVAVDDPEKDMGMVQGSVQLLSTLHIARSKLFPRPYVIGRGCNCVERARELMESLRLPVSAAYSGALLRRDIVMEAGDSYLDAANLLLASAGFRPCEPDAYGGVVMRPWATGRTPDWEFRSGDGSILEHVATEHDGLSEAPNAVHLLWEDDGVSCWASAVNDDPLSPLSVRNIGYEVGTFDSADDPGEGTDDVLEAVKAQAVRKLESACSGCSTVTVAHPYVPLSAGDLALVDYSEAGIGFLGEVLSVAASWDEKGHVSCETTVGAGVSAVFNPTVRGGML